MKQINKIKGEAKSIVLTNGRELTYCERGEQNKEVLITGALYFHTFMPVVEGLSERYHVYGVVMNNEETGGEVRNADGTVHWGNTWGEDIYAFAKAMCVERFHYLGKCHGTMPGWWLFKNHPEAMIDFCSFYMLPHLRPQTANRWFSLMNDPQRMMAAAMNRLDRVQAKLDEMQSIGGVKQDLGIMKYLGAPELMWNTLDECEAALREAPLPVCYMFGSEDPFFRDHYDSNMYAWQVTRGCKFEILQGEKHLMEIDCPERVVREAFAFIDEAAKYFVR